MFEFDFEDLWDEQAEEELIGTWAYIGRHGYTTYRIGRTDEGRLRFDGPGVTGSRFSGFLQLVQDRSLEAVLTDERGEEAGTIHVSFSKEAKAVVSRFRGRGKEAWGQEIKAHRTEDTSEDKANTKPGPAAAPDPRGSGPGAAAGTAAAAAPPGQQGERRPASAKADMQAWPEPQQPPRKDLPKSWLNQFQQPAMYDLKEASTSPFASQVSDLSCDVFGISLLVGLDNLLKQGKSFLSVMAMGTTLMGFVMFSTDDKKPEICVHYLVVHGHFRGRGCGCNLLKHVQEKCISRRIPRMVATCRFDQLFYFLRVGFYFSVQPPPDLQFPSAEVTKRLHHVRFGVEHPLGRPASGLLGRPPAKQPLPPQASGWSDLEREFFQRTQGKYVVEEVAQLRREPSKERASVVIPTMEARQEFHEQFCACFEAQNWPDTELVVVETYERFSSPAVASLARRLGKRVIHVKFQTSLTIGLKRNLGAHLATGQYIVHFDDDDLYAPGYVTTMVNGLKQRNLKALTLCSWYNCNTNSNEVTYTDPVDGTWGYEGIVYGFGFSYAYYREVALKYPFPHVSLSEDNQFMSRLRTAFGDEKVGLMRDPEGICLHLIHGNNTSGCGSHRDVSTEEAAGLKVCDLHALARDVDTKGFRALSHLVWSQRRLSKDEAQEVLSFMKRFLSMPSIKNRVISWASFCVPGELHKRVSDMLWQEVYPEIFLKLGLPVNGGLSILMGSMETRFRDDPKLIALWQDVQKLQGNEEAAQKIGRHLVTLQGK